MTTEYRGFTIKPKLDFGTHGFFINGKWVREGFVVVQDGCNAMPAAAWFQTVEQAQHAIDVLIEVDGNATKFWEVLQPFPYTHVGQKVDFQHGLIKQGRFSAVIENYQVVKLKVAA